MMFFQLMSRRYEHAATILISNKPFEDWGEVFGDEVTAAALIDRLLHHCRIVNIRGTSYRMRDHRALANRLMPPPPPPDRDRRPHRQETLTAPVFLKHGNDTSTRRQTPRLIRW